MIISKKRYEGVIKNYIEYGTEDIGKPMRGGGFVCVPVRCNVKMVKVDDLPGILKSFGVRIQG